MSRRPRTRILRDGRWPRPSPFPAAASRGSGFSGAGAFAFNEIALDVSATIDGGSADNIASQGVTVAAADTSTIDATVSRAPSPAVLAENAAWLSAIGVSFARNSITDPVTAYITDVPSLTTDGGAVSVTATKTPRSTRLSAAVAIGVAVGGESGIAVAGGGALAANFIDAATEAYISGSTLGDSGRQSAR